jgi:hypothetical protein
MNPARWRGRKVCLPGNRTRPYVGANHQASAADSWSAPTTALAVRKGTLSGRVLSRVKGAVVLLRAGQEIAGNQVR